MFTLRLGRAIKDLGEHKMTIFARNERLDEKYNWRPVRAEIEESTVRWKKD